MVTRLSKIILIWAVALFSSLVALGNLTDYDSNFVLVVHVLTMDTTFPDNSAMWRAIEANWAHHLVFASIILAEVLVALLCWLGGFQLLKARNNPLLFNAAKKTAIAGLTLGILLWFTGFITIGGEWFLMWQSQVANVQQAAFRLVMILLVILIYVVQQDGESGNRE